MTTDNRDDDDNEPIEVSWADLRPAAKKAANTPARMATRKRAAKKTAAPAVTGEGPARRAWFERVAAEAVALINDVANVPVFRGKIGREHFDAIEVRLGTQTCIITRYSNSGPTIPATIRVRRGRHGWEALRLDPWD